METTGALASAQPNTQEQPFKSKLQRGPERFLAYAIEYGLKNGRRKPADFIRHFPPKTIMTSLEDQPELRAEILVAATGVRLKVALKKSADSCGSDLQIALDEHETDAETVVGLFEPDDRVRFLDHRALWNFVVEGEFWQSEVKKDPKAHALAASHVRYLIERALDEQLLTHHDVVKGITVERMVALLPRSELPKILEAALELGRAKRPFVEKNLLDALGIATLTTHLPLASLWTQVVVPYIADAHGFTPVGQSKAEQPAEPAKPSAAAARAPAGSAAGAQPAGAFEGEDSGLDLEVEEVLGALASGKPPPSLRPTRISSIPPRP